MTRIAVIGAGIGGIALASRLATSRDVVVFEKGRGMGGRMASRHADAFSFDHGAQYFTVRDPAFAALLAPAMAAGAVALWTGSIARIANSVMAGLAEPRDRHLVGVPNMNSVVKALADGLDVRLGVEIAPLAGRTSRGWRLAASDGTDHGLFDWVISTTTAHQTTALFAGNAPSEGALRSARMAPCYALMLGFAETLDLPWIAARVSASPIEWIGVNSTKPGRDDSGTALVIHSTSEWATTHLGQDIEPLGVELAQALHQATGIDSDLAIFRATHRWASARRLPQPNSRPYVDPLRQLAATGDWTSGSRVEDTVLSALDLADSIEREQPATT
jgi:renalase